MRTYWSSKADQARDMDFDLPRQLLNWAESSDYKIQNEDVYFILHQDEYRVFYSRASQSIQCYYLGYGYDCVTEPIDSFEELEDILEFIEENKEMELILTPVVEKIGKEIKGKSVRWHGSGALQEYWTQRLKEELGEKYYQKAYRL